MLIKKGTWCKTLCCKSKAYQAQFDFELKQEPMVCNDIVYLRGKCFPCKLKEIEPELNKNGIFFGNK